MGRLSIEKLQHALDLRVAGKTYGEIAAELGVANDSVLHAQIADVLRNQTSALMVNVLQVAAIDLMRLEAMVGPTMEYALNGSHHHVKAAIALIREKRDVLEWMQKVQANADEDESTPTLSPNSPEYQMALEALNAQQLVSGDAFDEIDHEGSLDLSSIPANELQLLRDQLAELEFAVSSQHPGEVDADDDTEED